jgi:orotate phosphoribosyltransferase
MVEINRRFLDEMQLSGMVRHGHFEFQSGHHSAVTLDRDRLLSDPRFASHLGYCIAKQYFTSVIQSVAAPSMWGAALAQWVGYFLQPRATVVFAPPDNGGFTIPETLRGDIEGRRVLLIDNLIISGKTMRRFAASVAEQGGEIIGAGTLWNTAGFQITERPVPVPVFSVFNQRFPVYAPESCPLCATGVPIETNPFPGWERAARGRSN